MIIDLVMAKNGYSLKDSFSFLGRGVQSKNKQLFHQIFP